MSLELVAVDAVLDKLGEAVDVLSVARAVSVSVCSSVAVLGIEDAKSVWTIEVVEL